jgi:hypothetical protein
MKLLDVAFIALCVGIWKFFAPLMFKCLPLESDQSLELYRYNCGPNEYNPLAAVFFTGMFS